MPRFRARASLSANAFAEASLAGVGLPGQKSSALRRADFAMCAVLLSACLVRFVGLGKESVWLDEATSLIIARMSLGSVVAWAAADVHPPLYYLALHFWLRLGETESAIRMLSAVLGVLTVAVAYGLARALFGRTVGFLAALLLALAPLHVWYSQEARMYVPVTMLSLLAARLLLSAMQYGLPEHSPDGTASGRLWLAYVAISTLALYTHYFALFAWFFTNVLALCWLMRHQLAQRCRWMLAQAAVVLLFLPWAPILLHQVTTGGGQWVERSIGRPTVYALVDTWLSFGVGVDSSLYPMMLRRLAYVAFAVCGLLALRGMMRLHPGTAQARARQQGLVFCAVSSGLPVLAVWLLSQFKPAYSTRYLLVFLPGYCMMVAAGLQMLPWKTARLMVVIVLLSTLLVGDWRTWRVEQNTDWRGVAEYVVTRAQTGDVVLFSPRWNVKPFEYYSRERVDTNMDLPIPVTAQAAESVVRELSKSYQRVWFVWDEGHYSDVSGIAKQVLEEQYTAMTDVRFRGVDHVLLYVRKPGRIS